MIHRFTNKDIMDGISELMQKDTADIFYSDPPWGQGNLNYWQTINKGMSNKFNDMDIKYDTMHMKDDMYRIQIVTILTNDSWLTKVTNWERKPDVHDYRQSKKGRTNRFSSTNKYING